MKLFPNNIRPVVRKGRYIYLVIALVLTAAGISWFGSSAAAQSESSQQTYLATPPNGVYWDLEEGDIVPLVEIDTTDREGAECTVEVTSANNESEHAANVLELANDGVAVSKVNPEVKGGATTLMEEKVTLGKSLVLTLYINDHQGISSLKATLTLTCATPEPTTTVPETTVPETTVPESTTIPQTTTTVLLPGFVPPQTSTTTTTIVTAVVSDVPTTSIKPTPETPVDTPSTTTSEETLAYTGTVTNILIGIAFALLIVGGLLMVAQRRHGNVIFEREMRAFARTQI